MLPLKQDHDTSSENDSSTPPVLLLVLEPTIAASRGADAPYAYPKPPPPPAEQSTAPSSLDDVIVMGRTSQEDTGWMAEQLPE